MTPCASCLISKLLVRSRGPLLSLPCHFSSVLFFYDPIRELQKLGALRIQADRMHHLKNAAGHHLLAEHGRVSDRPHRRCGIVRCHDHPELSLGLFPYCTR